MKKTLVLLAALAFVLVPSCTKPVEEDPEGNDLLEQQEQDVTVEFEATLLETKTHLGAPEDGEWPNYWSDGDAIQVNDKSSVALSDGDGYVGTNYAKFTINGAVSSPYLAAYPASAVSNYNNGSATITIPATQEYKDSAYDPNAYIMIGKSTTPRLSFEPMMGLIQLTTTTPDEGTLYVKSIVVEPVGGEKMCGPWSTKTDYKGITPPNASENNTSITIEAPNGTSMDGAVFTFAIPAQIYASGIRFRINAVPNADGSGTPQTMAFSKQSAFTVEAGKLYHLTAPAFKESAVTIANVWALTSSSIQIRWNGSNVLNNRLKAWRIHAYTNSTCTIEVGSGWTIPKSETACWDPSNPYLTFVVGGLSRNTQYWFRVEDVQNGVFSDPSSSVTTEAFTPVEMPASITSTGVVLAEDFSQLAWGSTVCFRRSAGFRPSNTSSFSNRSTEDATFYRWDGAFSFRDAAINDALTNSRLNDWLSESNIFANPGLLKLGTASGSGWILTPVFPSNALVNVSVTAAKYNAEAQSDYAVAVLSEALVGTGSGYRQSNFSWPDTSDESLYKIISFTSNSAWQTSTAEDLVVTPGDRIMIGRREGGGDSNPRLFINSIRVEATSLAYVIKDVATLQYFMTNKPSEAIVVADIDMTGQSFTTIADYTGTLNGNGHTISGLTVPMFATLKGTVSNLTLYSNINRTTDVNNEGIAIFAEKSEGTITGCTAKGSVEFKPSSAMSNATRYVAGIVGCAEAGSTLTNCTNEALIQVPSNSLTNSLILHIGGVVGRTMITDSDAIGTLINSGSITCGITNERADYIGGVVGTNNSDGTTLSNCTSTGGTITYNGVHTGAYTGSDDCDLYIGGVVGYSKKPISGCSSAMDINVGGSFTPSRNMYYSTGGVVGSMSANQLISNCLNTGDITVSQTILGSNGTTYIGGLAGRTEGSISNSSNGGSVSFTGRNNAKNPCIGGLVGETADNANVTISGKHSTASATNYGKVDINTSTQTNKYFYVGGVAGYSNCSITATNAGAIDITELKCTRLYLGGITGNNTVALGAGNSNLADGDITIYKLNIAYEYLYLGGIVGRNNASVTSAINDGDIDIKASDDITSKKSVYIGGIVGRGEANITSCTNNGDISNACPVTTSDSYIQVGGVVGYNNADSIVDDCHNTGDVSNSGNCNGYLCVGGITSEADAAVSNCDNTGAVSNSGDSGNGRWIAIGGVVGRAGADISSCSNGTSSKAGGTVSNSGNSDEDVCIGGVAGTNDGVKFTTCYNKGKVENSGDSKSGYNINIGGLAGWSSANSVYKAPCYNTGAISNTGVGSNTEPSAVGVRMGGLIGTIGGVNTLTGTSSSYNYNSGTLSETSSSSRAAIGGIAGYNRQANTDMDYVRNLDSGDITFQNNTRDTSFVGGILGCANAAVSIDHASNAGDVKIRNITVSTQLLLGGIIGGFTKNCGANTVTYCTNSGKIDVSNSGNNGSNMKAASADVTGFSYIGGISGVGEYSDKTFTNCTNSGTILMYNQVPIRLGGILGYSTVNPTGCVNTGSISVCKYNAPEISVNGEVGGVVGYMNITTPTNLTSDANVRTTGSTPNCYTGGIVGRIGASTTGFSNCKVGTTTADSSSRKTISGASEGQWKKDSGAGLFASRANGEGSSYSFSGCKIKSGTKCQNVEITDSNKATYVIGRRAPTSTSNLPTIVSSF